MSEKLSKDWLREIMPTATILNDDKLCVEMLSIAAAAEERGRRRGVEERDALRAALERARSGLDGEHYLTPNGIHAIGYEQSWDETDCPLCSTDPDKLAPRDSAPQPARMDAPGGPRCWCGRLSVSESGWCGGCESPTEPA